MFAAFVPVLRDLVGLLKAWVEHRWKATDDDPPGEPETKPGVEYVEQDLPPDVIWLNREIARLEAQLVRCRKAVARNDGEVEQLRGEVEFLVDQLQEAVEERDAALAREARLRAERGKKQ
jgi:hypothetical protein